ncbi:flagellar biosynthesis regulator FlaF [Tropicimonas sediminicola]|uniref:Flagellar protein FlaF n=1 Tax=Tropicimonas sediminicola TaxID=1031541 RepID=A0A239JBA5_9RHOB|nr:flagellar biosynthesis regulator FlaF [Tropicimonas sediminicola]SNT03306.1 flagellar protein FlaF [Tropicimonas sediminicola]
MNAIHMAQKAYGAAAAPVRTSRSVEYAAFLRVTRDLSCAAEAGRTGFASLAKALHDNRRLWSVLASDVASSDNHLPPTLRAQIFYLAEFVEQQSRKVLKGEGSAETLVDINTAMMRGLSTEGSEA